MKTIKLNELRKLSANQLNEKLTEIKKELLKVNAKIATKVIPENPGSIKQMKKAVARILTIKKENKKQEGGKSKVQ